MGEAVRGGEILEKDALIPKGFKDPLPLRIFLQNTLPVFLT